MAENEPAALGAIALRQGLITRDQLARALELQKAATGKRLGEICVEQGFLTPAQVKTLLAAAAKLIPPDLRDAIPGYEILERLGAGGMGAVYKARHVALDRWVALKVMKRDLAEDPDYIRRFLVEARTAGKLRHENIVGALDCGEARGHYYMVMEFVDGRPLDAILRQRGRLPEREALELVKRVADGLQYAWDHQIVHRDVKPQNILVMADGTPKICDLGLCRDVSSNAKLTTTGAIHCTPAYASPEQARGERDLDTRSDIYSLGATLYEMVTGATPFDGQSAGDLLIKQATETPPPPISRNPSLSPAVNAIILHMLEKSRERRPQTPGAVSERVRAILAGETAAPAARVVPRARRPQSPAPRRRLWIVAGIGGVLLLAGLLLAFLMRRSPSSEPGDRERRIAQLRERSRKTPDDPRACAALLDEWRALGEPPPAEFRASVENRLLALVEAPRREERMTAVVEILEPFARRGLPGVDALLGEVESEIRRRWKRDREETEAARAARDAPRLEAASARIARYSSVKRENGSLRWFDAEIERSVEPCAREIERLRARPTGPYFVFAHRGPRDRVAALCLMTLDGKDRRRILSGDFSVADPSWSRDGSKIAFRAVSGPGADELALCDADGRGLRRLPATRGVESRAGWSPDGKRLVYAAGREGRSRICVYDIDSEKETWISPGSEDARAPDWAPDPRWIAYVRCASGRIGPLIVLLTNPLKIWNTFRAGDGACSASWSPDGLRLACVYYEKGRFTLAALSTRDWGTELTASFDGPVSEVSTPSWSPDGTRILVSARSPDGSDLYVIERSRGKFEFLTRDNAPGEMTLDPAWAPDRP